MHPDFLRAQVAARHDELLRSARYARRWSRRKSHPVTDVGRTRPAAMTIEAIGDVAVSWVLPLRGATHDRATCR